MSKFLRFVYEWQSPVCVAFVQYMENTVCPADFLQTAAPVELSHLSSNASLMSQSIATLTDKVLHWGDIRLDCLEEKKVTNKNILIL